MKAGDRVFGMARTHGSYAEYTAVPVGAETEPLARIPDGVTDEQAAALPVAAVAALGSLELLALSAGEGVVIMGAAGAVGGYAVQMAAAGGHPVIATVRGLADAEEARRRGASEVHDAEAADVISELRAAHPQGVAAVLDIVNGRNTIQRDAQILVPGARLVSTVFGADVGWFAQRNITAHNIVGHRTPFGGTANPMQSPAGLADIAAMLAAGTITTRIRSTVCLRTPRICWSDSAVVTCTEKA